MIKMRSVSELADRQLNTALDDSRSNGIARETGDFVDVELGQTIM
jgi:hypothetical protein